MGSRANSWDSRAGLTHLEGMAGPPRRKGGYARCAGFPRACWPSAEGHVLEARPRRLKPLGDQAEGHVGVQYVGLLYRRLEALQ